MKPSKWFIRLCCFAVAGLLIAPLLIVITLSFTSLTSFRFPPEGPSMRWFSNFFSSDEWMSSLWLSLKIALTVGFTSCVLGSLAAIGVVRLPRKFSLPITGLVLMPLIVPPIVLAVGTYQVFLDSGLLGTFLGYVIVDTALAIPYVFVTTTASLANYDRTLELAAMNLGATRLTVLRSVTVPLIMPGIASGFVFAFTFAFDEVIIAQFIGSPGNNPLAVTMWTSISRGLDPTIAAASTLIIFAVSIGIAAVVFGQHINGKRKYA